MLACDLFLFSYLVTYFLLSPAHGAIVSCFYRDDGSRSLAPVNGSYRSAGPYAAACRPTMTMHAEPRSADRSARMNGTGKGAVADGAPVVILDLPSTGDADSFHKSDKSSGRVGQTAQSRPREAFRMRSTALTVTRIPESAEDAEQVVILDLATDEESKTFCDHAGESVAATSASASLMHGDPASFRRKFPTEHDEPVVILDFPTCHEPDDHGRHADGSRLAALNTDLPLRGYSRITPADMTAANDEPVVIIEDMAEDDDEPVIIINLSDHDGHSGPDNPSEAQKSALVAPKIPSSRPSRMAPSPQPFFVRPEFVGLLILADLLLLLFCWHLTGSFRFIIDGRSYVLRAIESNSALGTFINNFIQCTQIVFVSASIERYRRMKTPSSLLSLAMVASFAMLFMNPFNTTRFVMASAVLKPGSSSGGRAGSSSAYFIVRWQPSSS